MSALVGMIRDGAITILTDGAATCAKTGALMAVHPKQVISAKNKTVIAGIGTWEPVHRFAKLAEERATGFDDLSRLAPSLWAHAKSQSASFSTGGTAIRYMLLYAGWSHAKQRMMMGLLDDDEHDPDCAGYLGGPGIGEDFRAFVRGYIDAGFDLERDRIQFFETIRREYPMQYETTQSSAVGGYIQETVVTREHIESARIWEWEDRLEHRIDASKEGCPRRSVVYSAALPDVDGDEIPHALWTIWGAVGQAMTETLGPVQTEKMEAANPATTSILMNLAAAPLIAKALGRQLEVRAGYGLFLDATGGVEFGLQYCPGAWHEPLERRRQKGNWAASHGAPSEAYVWLETEDHLIDLASHQFSRRRPGVWPALIFWPKRSPSLPATPAELIDGRSFLRFASSEAAATTMLQSSDLVESVQRKASETLNWRSSFTH